MLNRDHFQKEGATELDRKIAWQECMVKAGHARYLNDFNERVKDFQRDCMEIEGYKEVKPPKKPLGRGW